MPDLGMQKGSNYLFSCPLGAGKPYALYRYFPAGLFYLKDNWNELFDHPDISEKMFRYFLGEKR